MGAIISPVRNFRNRSDESTTQEFDNCSWFLAIGRRSQQTRIDPSVKLATITPVAVSPHVPIENHLHIGAQGNIAAFTCSQPTDMSGKGIGFEAFEGWHTVWGAKERRNRGWQCHILLFFSGLKRANEVKSDRERDNGGGEHEGRGSLSSRAIEYLGLWNVLVALPRFSFSSFHISL